MTNKHEKNDDSENNLIFFWPYCESKQEEDDEKFLIWSEIKKNDNKKSQPDTHLRRTLNDPIFSDSIIINNCCYPTGSWHIHSIVIILFFRKPIDDGKGKWRYYFIYKSFVAAIHRMKTSGIGAK